MAANLVPTNADPADLYADFFREAGPDLTPGVDYGVDFGPPAPSKPLPNGEGVMVSERVAAE